jgi:mannose-6-phosphate isomerase-like protein (cupin superfamily)
MTLITASAAPVFDLPGVRFIGLASPSRGSRENAVWRVTLQPGTPPQPHRLTREEIFVALSGSAEATIAGVSRCVEAGSALVVPRDTEFALANPGTRPFEAVVVLPVGGEALIGDAAPFVPPWAA